MRDTGPVAALVGLAALLWIAWELLRVLLLRGAFFGMTGAALDLRVADPGGSWGLEVLLPAFLAVLFSVSMVGVARITERIGLLLLALGTLATLGWTVLVLICGVSGWIDTLVPLPVFFQLPDPLSWWSAWGRWWMDVGLLGGFAVLQAMGVSTLGRRALWAVGLAVIADSSWRALVTLTSGQIPLLAEGSQVWGGVMELLWILAGLFAAAFVFVFACLPAPHGPTRNSLLGLLGLAGVWLGLQGALLFTGGSLQAMGLDGRLIFPIPMYESLLAALRLSLLVAGTAAVAGGAWRLGADGRE